MDVFLDSLGCRLNEAERDGWARAFRRRGHRLVGSAQEAQLVVLNTCAVTRDATRGSRQRVHQARRANPSSYLVVTGCYAELEPERVAALEGVDLVLGNRDKDDLVARIDAGVDPHALPQVAAAPDSTHPYLGPRTRSFVKVQDGCRNRCAFCVVTLARGEERSRPVDAVVVEVAELAAGGSQEAVLTGVHLGGYGHDLGTDLRRLVEAVLTRTTIARLRLSSLEPWDLPEGFFELWSEPRLMPHLHLPLQSGSDAVLRRMARRCTTAEFAGLVETARAAIPGLTVTSDVIVGFPGESEAEFEETLRFVERVGFGHTHIFSYSPRAGTKAATMAGQVPKATKRARSKALHRLTDRLERAHTTRFLETTRPVLWERSGRVEDGAIRWSGHTDNYLRVCALTPRDVELGNTILPARLTRLDADGRTWAEPAVKRARLQSEGGGT